MEKLDEWMDMHPGVTALPKPGERKQPTEESEVHPVDKHTVSPTTATTSLSTLLT